MKATDELMSEYRVIERVIVVLEKAANRLEQNQAVRPGLFIEATDFIKGFADGCHHKKEEGVLFQSMAAYGAAGGRGTDRGDAAGAREGRVYTRACVGRRSGWMRAMPAPKRK